MMKSYVNLFSLVSLFIPFNVYAADNSSYASQYGDIDTVSIATGSQKAIRTAPAVISVVKSEDIEIYPATSLADVMATIPGMHISVTHNSYETMFILNGVRSVFDVGLLLLVDGFPSAPTFYGKRVAYITDFNIRDIAHIEVIRGPGAVIHGADAHIGVINIVTKGANKGEKNTFGAIGSKEDGEIWARSNFEASDNSRFSLSINGGKRDGDERYIEADAQTTIDGIFSTNSSLAPKNVDPSTEFFRAQAKYDSEHLAGQLRFNRIWNKNYAFAITQALTRDEDTYNFVSYEFDLKSKPYQVSENLIADAFLVVSDVERDDNSDTQFYPPNAFGGIFGPFPDGAVMELSTRHRYYQAQGQLVYDPSSDHRLTFGAGGSLFEITDVTHRRNFTVSGGVVTMHPSVQDFSAEMAAAFSEDRRNIYAFLQDEWQITNDLEFTVGARIDDYNRFGSEFLPRAALVWSANSTSTYKLLYGKAFKPPNYFHMNIPDVYSLSASDELKAETSDQYQLSYEYVPATNFTAGITAFYYRVEDPIRLQVNSITDYAIVNAGVERSKGITIEGAWKVSNDVKLRGNITKTSATNETGQDTGGAPRLSAYLLGEWKALPELLVSLEAYHAGDRRRSGNDTRAPIDDYTTFDMKIRKNFSDTGSVSLIVKNMTDEDVREPSENSGFIRGDLPLSGRKIYLEANYNF